MAFGEALASSFLANLASTVVGRVASFVSQELVLAWRLKDDLNCLKESLQLSQALLSDAAHKTEAGSSNTAVQLWLSKLNEVVLDANNLLDELEYELLRQRVENHKVRNKFLPSFNPRKIALAHKIRDIKSSFDKIYEKGQRMGLRPSDPHTCANSATTPEIIRQTPPNVDDLEVVGRENDESAIIKMLCPAKNEEVALSVVAIVGMGGLGKTTLAQKVYKSDEVANHFKKRMWVTISEDFDARRVLSEVLQSLTGKNSQLTNLQALIMELNKELSNERFLLVMDDVWNEESSKWDVMRNSLLGISGCTGSKILITTRKHRVPEVMRSSSNHVYQLERLSSDAGWALFKRNVFAEGGPIETESLVAIGEKMVKQCNGLPLAIKTLGGLLYYKRSVRDWSSIEKNPCWDSTEVLPSLKLSFDHLQTPSLKLCFAYCAIFPKDFWIEKDGVIQQWMALGLLHDPNKRNDMEDVGEDYFNILLRNSLLQDVGTDENNNIVGCKMHDLVHDLAVKVSQNQCITLNGNHDMNDVASEAIHVRMTGLDKLKQNEYLKRISKRVQTLFIDDCFDDRLLERLEHLRILVLMGQSITELPSSIGKLKHLRYLGIFSIGIRKLSKSITKLYCLQTLRVINLEELPNRFLKNLINLRHLCFRELVKGSRTGMVRGIRQLTCLRTLPFFKVSEASKCQVEELGGLDSLRGPLVIGGLGDVRNMEEARKAKLSAKSDIQVLMLSWDSNSASGEEESSAEAVLEGLEPHSNLRGLQIVRFKGNSFASWMMMETRSSFVLQNLVRIQLDNCSRCEQLPPLGHLPNLEEIKIYGMDRVKIIGGEFYGVSSSTTGHGDVAAFPALRALYLRGMPVLEKWSESRRLPSTSSSANHHVFPCLEVLMISDCPNLIHVPGHFPALEEFSVVHIKDAMALEKMSSSSSLTTSLTGLHLWNIPGTEVDRVVEQFLGHNALLTSIDLMECHELSHLRCSSLPNLTWLRLHSCEKLAEVELSTCLESLSLINCPVMDLRYLTRLTSLEIGSSSISSNLRKRSEVDCFPWPSLLPNSSSLKKLTLYGWEEVKSLTAPPEQQLQHLSHLEDLHLNGFDGLESLPDWLGHLSGLRTLSIANCKNLMKMPSEEAMRALGNLNTLDIYKCPLLQERCTKGSGAEWYKIARVPNITIDYVNVQGLFSLRANESNC